MAEHGQIVISAATATAADAMQRWRQDLVGVAGFATPVEVAVEDTLRLGDLLVDD